MKTPDKIFISVERTYGASDGQVIAMVTSHNERQSIDDVEYIRKDALLEWLERKTESAEIIVANSVNRWVTRQVYKQVMDKLNSM